MNKAQEQRLGKAVSRLLRDVSCVVLAIVVTLFLQRQGSPSELLRPAGVTFLVAMALVSGAALYWRRISSVSTRYIGIHDLVNISITSALLGGVFVFLAHLQALKAVTADPWTGGVLFAFLCATSLSLGRIHRRITASRMVLPNGRRVPRRILRTLIVGAGDDGEMTLRELSKQIPIEHQVVAFVDSDPQLLGTTIHGVPVRGSFQDIPRICRDESIHQIYIALGNEDRETVAEAIRLCAQTEARLRTMPAFADLLNGGSDVFGRPQHFDVADLLPRTPSKSPEAPLKDYISGERILITGAGGSIGGELAHQVGNLAPASLILLGKGENSVHEADVSLRSQGIFQPTPAICDVRDRAGLNRVFRSHIPSVVFHAAAHKHVPLMESVPIEAIRNNVFGTLNVVEASIRAGVRKMILISTDKAVNPSNVMGASKRVAEMIVSAHSSISDTDFSIVRFGNVLGSRGSLIPTLVGQINRGGPVTITHPDMTRYFMTIPEAVELVLQAGAMGQKGEIFILDMGDPIKIVTLAQRLIRMYGLVPGQDIEIKFTGVRPGEKIHEELASATELLIPSRHPRISVVDRTQPISWEWLQEQLRVLDRICDEGDAEAARAFLMELAWGRTMPPVGTRA